MGLERGPLSLVSTAEVLLRRYNSGSGLEDREQPRGSVELTTRHPLSAKVGTNFADKVAVARSLQFAHRLRPRSLVF
jgi:hypothetical protein